MNCYSLQNRVVFLQLKSFCSILSIFCCDITRCSRHTAIFMFCTFQNHLYSITFCFLCHNQFSPLRLANHFNGFPITIPFSNCIVQCSIQSFFVNNAQTSSTKAKADPAVLFYIIELLVKQVQIKGSLCSSLYSFYLYLFQTERKVSTFIDIKQVILKIIRYTVHFFFILEGPEVTKRHYSQLSRHSSLSHGLYLVSLFEFHFYRQQQSKRSPPVSLLSLH